MRVRFVSRPLSAAVAGHARPLPSSSRSTPSSTADVGVHRRGRIGNRRLAARAIAWRGILALPPRITPDHRLLAWRGSRRAMTALRFMLLEGRIPEVVVGLSFAAIASHRTL